MICTNQVTDQLYPCKKNKNPHFLLHIGSNSILDDSPAETVSKCVLYVQQQQKGQFYEDRGKLSLTTTQRVWELKLGYVIRKYVQNMKPLIQKCFLVCRDINSAGTTLTL